MPETIKRLELAKPGQYGMDGTTITAEHLQEVVDTFAGSVPVTIGHEMARKDYFPQFGEVLTVALEGEGDDAILVGDVQMSEILAEAYDQGFYTGWSVGFPARGSDGKRYFHHLAFLGAMPPKIKDLKVIKELAPGKSIDMSDQTPATTFCYVKKEVLSAPKGSQTSKIQVPTAQSTEDNMTGKKQASIVDPEPTTTRQSQTAEFSDAQKRQLRRAEETYKKAKREALKAAASNVVPEEQLEALVELSDNLSASDYETIECSDDPGEGRAAVDILIDIFKAIPQAQEVGELNLSDDFGRDNQAINGNELAMKF